jgi:SAM-dependent methyltransferase
MTEPRSSERLADVETRSLMSLGSSNDAIYRMVRGAVANRHPGGGLLIDVGCGNGELWPYLNDRFDRYLGLDAIRHSGFPQQGEFHKLDFDRDQVDMFDDAADVVAAVEVIEHLENPRLFFRKLVKMAKPNGLIVVTTPNQLSLLSLVILVVKKEFNAFREAPGLYPAHLSALLEIDLRRIANESGLVGAEIRFSNQGRMPMLDYRWPSFCKGQLFSENVAIVARKPAAGADCG